MQATLPAPRSTYPGFHTTLFYMGQAHATPRTAQLCCIETRHVPQRFVANYYCYCFIFLEGAAA